MTTASDWRNTLTTPQTPGVYGRHSDNDVAFMCSQKIQVSELGSLCSDFVVFTCSWSHNVGKAWMLRRPCVALLCSVLLNTRLTAVTSIFMTTKSKRLAYQCRCVLLSKNAKTILSFESVILSIAAPVHSLKPLKCCFTWLVYTNK